MSLSTYASARFPEPRPFQLTTPQLGTLTSLIIMPMDIELVADPACSMLRILPDHTVLNAGPATPPLETTAKSADARLGRVQSAGPDH